MSDIRLFTLTNNMISKPLLTLAIGTAILVTSCADNGNGKEEEKVDPTVALADAKKEFRNKKESEFTDFLERLQLAQDEASGVEIMDFVETISTEYDGESVSLNLGDERDVVIIMSAYDQEGFEEFEDMLVLNNFSAYLELGLSSAKDQNVFSQSDMEDIVQFSDLLDEDLKKARSIDLNKFNVLREKMERWINAEYYLIIKQMICKPPSIYMGSSYNAGSVEVGVLVLRAKDQKVMDMFSFQATNSEEVDYERDLNDFDKNQANLMYAVRNDLKANFRDMLLKKLKRNHKVDNDLVFFDLIMEED